MDKNKTFQISIKGLCFDAQNHLMMIKEEDGTWEIPGGRLEAGEEILSTLKREIKEEMGLECEIVDQKPFCIYSTFDQDTLPRLMIFYKIRLNNLDFTPSDECIEINFFSKKEISQLNLICQLKSLISFLD